MQRFNSSMSTEKGGLTEEVVEVETEVVEVVEVDDEVVELELELVFVIEVFKPKVGVTGTFVGGAGVGVGVGVVTIGGRGSVC